VTIRVCSPAGEVDLTWEEMVDPVEPIRGPLARVDQHCGHLWRKQIIEIPAD